MNNDIGLGHVRHGDPQQTYLPLLIALIHFSILQSIHFN